MIGMYCFLAGTVFALWAQRTRSVKTIRDQTARSSQTANESPVDQVAIVSIGEVRSGFKTKRGVPRQGSLAPSLRAKVVLHPHLVSSDTLIGLEEFSHVWILFVFSRNSNGEEVERWKSRDKNLFKSKVRPPVLGGRKVGVFSTRSPHRPNPIGMTLARIESVDVAKGVLVVSGIDLCDHTPVVDLKPFVPADVVPEPRFASWVMAPQPYEVVFTAEAEEGLRTCGRGRKYYEDLGALRDAVTDVLALDVRGVSQKRGAVEPGVTHKVVVDGVVVVFSFEADRQVLVRSASLQ